MGLTATFSEPFFTGGATSEDVVPFLYPLSLDGIGFLVDDVEMGKWHDESIPFLRPQSDDSSSPSESSFNPEALWRRSVDSWHKGAGQEMLDAEDGLRTRFRASKGVDIWNLSKLSLLHDTELVYPTVETNLYLLAVADRLFMIDGSNIVFSDDNGANWDPFTGPPGGDILSFTHDGFYIYATTGTNIYRIDALAGAPAFGAAWNTLDCDLIKYVKGRLMAAKGPAIYDVTSSTPPSAHFTHSNTNFAWVDFTEGPKAIYAAIGVNNISLIYRIGILEDGSGLDAPIVTAQIPEQILSLGSYLGFIFAGTNTGVRFSVPDSSNGDLSEGALLDTDTACYAFEGIGNKVWFGWDNFDATSSGLGRFSLEQFASLEKLAPAYASDLMATDQGSVKGIVTVNGLKFFSVAGGGLYAETLDYVASGYVESGEFDYGFTGTKIALYADVQRLATEGSYQFYFKATGDADYTLMGSSETVTLQEKEGVSFEWKIVLVRDADPEITPIIDSITIRAQPIVRTGEFQIIPIILATSYKIGNKIIPRNPDEDLARIKGWRRNQTIITCAQGHELSSVVVADYVYERRLTEHNIQGFGMDGTCTVKLKTLE